MAHSDVEGPRKGDAWCAFPQSKFEVPKRLRRGDEVKRATTLLFLIALAGCGHSSVSAADARKLADAEMYKHCASRMTNCVGLSFNSVRRTNGLWLVEYEAKDYLYGAIVDDNGSVEITFTNEK
ncbi:hypothetical protein [Stenotrophomonas panacihumi]|uniref:hypothetical protein n=1 Tax=Stenotrophomonas panacihumi TaxID=676599 RepID=UPI0011B2085A|nr:hypothetical protein [Stenotrophomonas panacihumi]